MASFVFIDVKITEALKYSICPLSRYSNRTLGNTVKNSRYIKPRFFTALFLSMIYLVIVMGPLAPVVLCNLQLAHAMTGECAGDCDVCGCSPEQRANHTCCCQQKMKQKTHQEASLADCCKKKQGSKVTVARCGCPCGSGKTAALLNTPNSETLPFSFVPGFNRVLSSAEHHHNFRCMPTRPGEPPDPPPRLSILS